MIYDAKRETWARLKNLPGAVTRTPEHSAQLPTMRTAAFATATATPTFAAAEAIAAAEAAATAANAGFFRTSFIHRHRAAVQVLAVQRGNCRLSFLIRTHLDKTEPFGTAGHSVAMTSELSTFPYAEKALPSESLVVS